MERQTASTRTSGKRYDPLKYSFEAVLRDGRRVQIRPIIPADRRHLVSGLAQMSERSRYLRFHGPIRRFADNQLKFLTELDYCSHMAWGAVALDEPGEPGVAVARYVRDQEDVDCAEAAITVLDDYQGNGLGTLLMDTLLLSAYQNGIERLVAHILPENTAARRLFQRLNAINTRIEDGVFVVELRVGGWPRRWRMSMPGAGPSPSNTSGDQRPATGLQRLAG
jgi:RimJ/RimL family protein N-acetyltransferase